MVVHNEVRLQEMAQTQKQKREKENRQTVHHLSVVAVQSVACCVVVLLALLLRVAGGDAYHSLQQSFHQALARNEWVSRPALMWDGDPLEKVENVVEQDVKEESFTEEQPAQLTGSFTAVSAIAPLESGTLTSAYGERIHPISGAQEFHSGVDIAAPTGTELVAAYDGKVIEVGENDQLGKYVRLSHGGGIEILYGHCVEIVATQGAQVKAGERVALVGSTGVSTGSHVHVCVKVDGTLCDPAALLPLTQYA